MSETVNPHEGEVGFRTVQGPATSIWLGGHEYKAISHVVWIPKSLLPEMEQLMKRGDVSANFVKIQSFEEAEAVARAHMKAQGGRPEALKGNVTSHGTIAEPDGHKIPVQPSHPDFSEALKANEPETPPPGIENTSGESNTPHTVNVEVPPGGSPSLQDRLKQNSSLLKAKA